MKFKIYILIHIFIIALFSSCTNDLLTQEQDSVYQANEYEFNLLVEDGAIRTRAVDFNPTGALRINQVWMGVFNMETGECVSRSKKILDYKTIQSGVVHQNLLKIYLEKPTQSEQKNYVMVAIANYLGVFDEKNEDLDSRLMDENLTWNTFNDIAVDVATAYSSPHNGLVPVLAGFVYSNDYTPDSHIKIDQFKEDQQKDNKVYLSPQNLQTYLTVSGNNDGYQLTNHTLKLRRLVANINVNIQLTNEALNEKQLELTDVSYKRYNMPKAVYIIERRTTDCIIAENGTFTPGNFPTDPNLSPNWADLDAANNYYNDTDWQYGNTTGFSFQHFANKHWARNEVNDQTGREDRTKYGTDPETGENLYYYPALVNDNNPNDFNNYASYFVVKMHLTDKKTGRALEAEYTIHEGNTSDELGNPVDNYTYDANGNIITTGLIGNPLDYVVARNIDYTYNIYVNGVDDIYHNVIKGENENVNHSNGQGGKVWEFFYANDETDLTGAPRERFKLDSDGNIALSSEPLEGICQYDYVEMEFKNTVPAEGGYFKNAIVLNNDNPDLAFRFYGYTAKTGHIEGYNYNFPQESFTWLHNLWPPSAGNYSHYFQDYDELIKNKNEIPEDLTGGIKIIDPETSIERDLVSFIEYANNKKFENKYFDIKVSKCNIATQPYVLKDNYVRTIYLADRKGEKDKTDGCTTLVRIFAAVQYPELEKKPNDPVQLPFPIFSTVNINNYNIIDQYLQTFTIPALPGISTEDYTYSLEIENRDYSKYGTLQNGNYVYRIPMADFPLTSGTIKLQVKPASGKENIYTESKQDNVGNVNLKNHAAWYNTEPEWLALLNNYISENSNTSQINGGYLKIFSTDSSKKMSRQSENGIYYLKTAGGANTIEFKVYKRCKISVTARTQNNGSAIVRRVDIKVDGTVTEHTLQLKSGASSGSGPWTTVTQNIENVPEGGSLINLNPGGGGIDIQSVQVSPL